MAKVEWVRFITDFKLAGDFDLWSRFFFLRLNCMEYFTVGFRKQSNQRSRQIHQYMSEVKNHY